MVGRLLLFWEGLFSGAMLDSGSVSNKKLLRLVNMFGSCISTFDFREDNPFGGVF